MSDSTEEAISRGMAAYLTALLHALALISSQHNAYGLAAIHFF